MTRSDGIVKERYTSEEIATDLRALRRAGLLDPDDEDALARVAREFYFRGLVHGRADEAKLTAVREEFGYADA